jgi:hypothetical protein
MNPRILIKATSPLKAFLLFVILSFSKANASISIVLNMGTVSGWSSGAVWLVSAGTDGLFSNPFINGGTSLAGIGDTFIAGVAITSANNSGGGALGSIAVPMVINYGTGIAQGNKIQAYYINTSNSFVSSAFDLATGSLKSGFTFGSSGGTSVGWSSYRSDNTETAGGGLDPTMGWVLPSDSGASGLNLSVFTLDDVVAGSAADFPLSSGALAFGNTVAVIPEPNSLWLLVVSGFCFFFLKRKLNGKKALNNC